MTNRKNRHPAFCLYRKIESGLEKAAASAATSILFLKPRNVSRGKLPPTIALDQGVRELHDSIERFAVGCSFYARFPQNNCRIVAIKPRQHVVVFKYVVMDF